MSTTNQTTVLVRLTEEEQQLINRFREGETMIPHTNQPEPPSILAWSHQLTRKPSTPLALDAEELVIMQLIRKRFYYQYLIGMSQGKGEDIRID